MSSSIDIAIHLFKQDITGSPCEHHAAFCFKSRDILGHNISVYFDNTEQMRVFAARVIEIADSVDDFVNTPVAAEF